MLFYVLAATKLRVGFGVKLSASASNGLKYEVCNTRLISPFHHVLQRYGPDNSVVAIDSEAKVVTLANGHKIQYTALLSTIPLDTTLR